ncbi:cell wall hydrolase [Paracoccus siganidrum]|uniref:Cell wall hydrolase n=1 Tax=Paracoccus siganidrum TaxID=1276757 RepID=A0A419AA66_9RHOB|nr:cell wall hydrolase [Paracoccus siganidrum]RJL19537.1 cell wall hydrolase [Paracoccus siganidrum]RMC32220.1 cell wall hydrolase [Paracoccus siganidrum]
MTIQASRTRLAATVTVALLALTGCSAPSSAPRPYSPQDLNCMERAIFFEANRSSRAGMIAVGTVVMNRVESEQFPDTVCGVVGQRGQFAPGVLTRPMDSSALPDVREAAIAVLRGERQPRIENAMFFHTNGYTFPYDNMHYVLVAGGNAFYEKRKSHLVTQRVPPPPIERANR